MTKYDSIIIGGGLAGQRAAKGLRKEDSESSVAIVTRERHLPYERPPLSKGYLRGEEGLDAVIPEEESWYAEEAIDVMEGVQATSVDAAAHVVTLDDGRALGYGKLLLATGGRAWRLPLPGAGLDGVFTLRTIEDSDAIQAAAKDAEQALVLGGSFIGSEVAASLTQLGVGVTMVFPESRLLERVVPDRFSDSLHNTFMGKGIRIRNGTTPESLEGEDWVERALLSDGRRIAVDMVVMGVGIRLNTDLAKDAGLAMTERGEVIVDATLQTSDPDIYAAGDIAAWPDPTFQRRLRVEHWDVARRQGLRAGRNMAAAMQGAEQKPYTSLPYFFSDIFDLSFEVWGDLTSWDETLLRGDIGSSRYQLFYFDRATDSDDRQLVGVLTVGRLGSARKAIPKLVKARPRYDDVAGQLEDEEVELGNLIE